MAKTAAEIKVILDEYLKTEPNPNSEELDILIKTLTNYRVRDWEEYKQQIPDLFGYNSPYQKQLKEKFRRMYNQLRKQGIELEYQPNACGEHCLKWKLTKGEQSGRLIMFTADCEWELHGFKFEDKQGDLLAEFSDVSCYDSF